MAPQDGHSVPGLLYSNAVRLSAWELDCHASADQHVAGQSLCPVVPEYPLSTDRTSSIGHAAGTLPACHARRTKAPSPLIRSYRRGPARSKRTRPARVGPTVQDGHRACRLLYPTAVRDDSRRPAHCQGAIDTGLTTPEAADPLRIQLGSRGRRLVIVSPRPKFCSKLMAPRVFLEGGLSQGRRISSRAFYWPKYLMDSCPRHLPFSIAAA